jgi:hypothetical protein
MYSWEKIEETVMILTGASPRRAKSPLWLAWKTALTVALCLAVCSGFALGQGQGASNDSAPSTVDRGKFRRSTIIDNNWFPMKPGTQWTYEGTSVEDDGKLVPHKVIVAITDLTKTIAGIRTVVSYELDYSDRELVEAELAFYAQDDEGNVWQFGEYPEEYEDGKFIKAPTWIHGVQGARAGIMMPAQPQLGTSSFAQGWGPSVGWRDRAIVFQVGQSTSVPSGLYDNVLVVKESAAGEQDAEQLKFYAPGLGNVRTGWTGTGAKVMETLELVKVEQLAAAVQADVDKKAVQLERSAYRHSKNVYAKTPAMVAAKRR